MPYSEVRVQPGTQSPCGCSAQGPGCLPRSGGSPPLTETVELAQPPSAQNMQCVHPKLQAGCNRHGGWVAGAQMTEVFSGWRMGLDGLYREESWGQPLGVGGMQGSRQGSSRFLSGGSGRG